MTSSEVTKGCEFTNCHKYGTQDHHIKGKEFSAPRQWLCLKHHKEITALNKILSGLFGNSLPYRMKIWERWMRGLTRPSGKALKDQWVQDMR